MVLVKTAAGELGVEFEGALLGKLHDPWLAKELFLIYFQEKGASSPKVCLPRVLGGEDGRVLTIRGTDEGVGDGLLCGDSGKFIAA